MPKIEDTSIKLYVFYMIGIANWTGHLQQNEKAEAVKPDLHHDLYTLLFVVGYIIRRWMLLPYPPKYMN